MLPQAAVAPPTSRVTDAMPTVRARPMFRPRPFATSSPMLSRFTAGPLASARSMPRAMNGTTTPITSKPRPTTAPAFQNRRVSSEALSLSAIAEVIELRNIATPMPASTKVSGEPTPRPRLESPKTRIAVSAVPRKANQTYWIGWVRPPRKVAQTTANAAPWVRPRKPGSATGLRVCPWISAPASASAAPAMSASRVRGTRSVWMMIAAWFSSGSAGFGPVV